jgi:hypothetical protein
MENPYFREERNVFLGWKASDYGRNSFFSFLLDTPWVLFYTFFIISFK